MNIGDTMVLMTREEFITIMHVVAGCTGIDIRNNLNLTDQQVDFIFDLTAFHPEYKPWTFPRKEQMKGIENGI